MIESGVTFDFGQLVMDNEFARMIKYTIGGIPVNDGSLAVDVIAEVGAFKDFLSHDDTYKHMKIQSQPRLIDRRVRDDWQASGSTDIYQRACAEARRLLEAHQPEALPDDVIAEVREIVAAADKTVVVS